MRLLFSYLFFKNPFTPIILASLTLSRSATISSICSSSVPLRNTAFCRLSSVLSSRSSFTINFRCSISVWNYFNCSQSVLKDDIAVEKFQVCFYLQFSWEFFPKKNSCNVLLRSLPTYSTITISKVWSDSFQFKLPSAGRPSWWAVDCSSSVRLQLSPISSS